MEKPKEISAAKKRKAKYWKQLEECLETYKNILILNVDNVGSNQMQQVRMDTRGEAVILMGKNTVIRKVLRDNMEKNPKLAGLLPVIRGNMGFCFTNKDLKEMRARVTENQVPAAARGGSFAPDDVIVPAGPTGLDPGQTQFFQALDIPTKIARGSIEIINDVHLIHKGERISSSAVALLSKLGLKPFFFGIKVTDIYEDGSVYSSEVMDLTEDAMKAKFFGGVRHVAALSLALHYPTAASFPHLIAGAFRKFAALSVATGFKFEQVEVFHEYLADPSKFAGCGGGGAAAASGGEAAAAAAEPEPEEEEEEEATDMGGLFGGDAEEAAY